MLSFVSLRVGLLCFSLLFSGVVAQEHPSPKDLQAIYEEAKKFAVDVQEKHAQKSFLNHEGVSEKNAPHEKGVCTATSMLLEGNLEDSLDEIIDEKNVHNSPCGKKKKNEKDTVLFENSPAHFDAQFQAQDQEKSQQKILIFVSFSMPKESLKHLMQGREKYNAVLILRGLKNNSFKETSAFLKTFESETHRGFELNPELFTRYQIARVPVFVLIKNDREISRLSGNVSLPFAAEKLKEKRS